MERCPCCNARLREPSLCPRCKTDLELLVRVEQAAQFWFAKAIQHFFTADYEHCIAGIAVSLNLKKTELAVAFREYLIHQQCREILDLLAQKQLLLAKQRLYSVRNLFPHSQQLQKIHAFCDYLLAQNPGNEFKMGHPTISLG